ncbi:MAG: hypothetical protein ABIP89_06030 [Polyangiaceae bacterium]
MLKNLFAAPIEPTEESKSPPKMPPAPAKSGVVDREAIEYIVAHGVTAPSPANVQPWLFDFRAGVLTLRNDPTRAFDMLDNDGMAAKISCGAVLENVTLAARSIGLEPTIDLFPEANDPDLVCRITFAPRAVERHAHVDWITKRCANRRLPEKHETIDPATLASLTELAKAAGVRLQFKEDLESLSAYETLLRFETRLGFSNKNIFKEFTGTFRWTQDEVKNTRDGLDVWALEAHGPQRAILRALTQRPNVESMREVGAQEFFEKPAIGRMTRSSAICLVTIPSFDGKRVVEAGKVVQRLWLTANAAGLAFQPQTFLPYYFMRVERSQGKGFEEEEIAMLREKRLRFKELFEVGPNDAEVFMFRLGRADPPTARALRRRLDDLLTFA